MSDFESVASEEDISIATDRSEAYDPLAYDYEVEDPNAERPALRRASADAAPGKSKGMQPLKSALVKTPAATINTSADQSDDYGDYSEFGDDFETESVNSKVSSGRQPKKLSPRESLRASSTASAAAQPHPPASQSPVVSGRRYVVGPSSPAAAASGTMLPSIEGLQAEVMLDEISKEVVRLRNQQRLVLMERRQVAMGKMARADERRAKHDAELQRYSSATMAAEEEKRELQEKLREAEKRFEATHRSSQLVAETNQRYETEIRRLEGIAAIMSAEAEAGQKSLRESRQALDTSRQQWLKERSELQAEVRRNELLVSVVQKSMEASEERLALERAKLPIHQQKSYDDAQARLSATEVALRDREAALVAEETRRMASIDALKRESMEQTQKHRMRIESDLAAERRELGMLKSQLEASRVSWDSQRLQETAALESLRADLRRKESEVDATRAALDQQRSELEVGQRLIEPNVRAAERDREDARALKAQADRVLFSAEEHASAILSAERGLVRREQAVTAAERGLESLRAGIVAERRALLAESAKQRSAQQALESERFRLHQCSMELSLQVATVKRGIAQMVRGADRVTLREERERELEGESNRSAGDSTGLGGVNEASQDFGENEENRLTVALAGKRNQLPASMDPALIHTAVSLQDVSRTLKSIAAATESHDPALDNILGPRGYRGPREEQLFDASQPFFSASPPPVPVSESFVHHHDPFPPTPAPAPAPMQSFEQARSELSRARESDEFAVSSVRSSVQSASQSSKTLASFAAKYGAYLRR